MEKKLKINYILKGIAIFAFVAFCLLAILAGVTLPFVSNASTIDSAVVSADNDCAIASVESDTFNPLDFSIPLSQAAQDSTLYYGIYITEDFFNFVSTSKTIPVEQTRLFSYDCVGGSTFDFAVIKKINSDLGVTFRYILGAQALFNAFEINTAVPYSSICPYYVYPSGFTVHLFNYFTDLRDKIYLFTSFPYGINEKIEYDTNYGFQSRFGFVGSMPSSNLYLNLQEKPILPDSLRTVKDSNGNLVNGWTFHDNSYWLPLINAYDGFGNPVDGGFTGWNVFNFQYNSAGELISQPELCFWFDDLTFTNDVNVNFVDGVLSIPDFTNISYRYESNFSNSDNLLVYASLNKSYKYYLQPNITQNDVYKFFALIDYRNYKPLDNDFYVAGYNSASSGYYDTGYKNGYAVGNSDGYNNGFSAGDSKGYQRGLNDANNYTFLSLFGAIFDAPIQALFGGTQRLPAGTKITDSSGKTITLTSDTVVNRGGMLNFELMGVNLSGFVLALFSLSIIIIVIKFALAKK